MTSRPCTPRSVCVVGTIDPHGPDPGQSAVLDAARALHGQSPQVHGVLLSASETNGGGGETQGRSNGGHCAVNARLRALSTGLAKVLDEQRPDVLHTVSGLAGLAALSVAPRTTALVHSPVGRVRGGIADDLARLERLMLRESRRVIAASNAEADVLVALGLRRERIDVVPYGVDPTLFSPDGPAWERTPGLSRVVTVARHIGEGSGVADVLRALRGVPDVELVVAGGPPCALVAGSRDVERLRALAQDLCVHHLRIEGFVPHAEIPGLLRSAELVVIPPRWGATGAVAVEAMACGRPVVTAAIGGDAEAVVEGTTGVVVDADDPDGLRRGVLQLLADPMRREGYGMAARLRVSARHDWAAVAQRLMESYAAAWQPTTLPQTRMPDATAVREAPTVRG